MVMRTGTIERRQCLNCYKLRKEALGRNDLEIPITDHMVTDIDMEYEGFRYECMRCGQVSFKIIKR